MNIIGCRLFYLSTTNVLHSKHFVTLNALYLLVFMSTEKVIAPRNRTIQLTSEDHLLYEPKLRSSVDADFTNKTIHGDLFSLLPNLPNRFADLIFIDPPYNLNKDFNGYKFKADDLQGYQTYLEAWLPQVIQKLKPNGSLYICGDWKSSAPIQTVLDKHMIIRNRITFEREKGRGAKTNWKNCSEDIWFATLSDDYHFDVEAVKMRRKVIAPYKVDGVPKDWDETESGNFRLTHPSNLWTDITIPFWSMPENTDHPTQKPEKLLAKIILASSKNGDVIFDPFLGSGTTSVVAKKLGRQYVGIEQSLEYCLLAERRLAMAESDNSIQGYQDGVFWERNSLK